MKNRIRLTESELRRMISESVKRVLKEVEDYDVHNDIKRLSKNYDDNLDDYYDEEGYYQDDNCDEEGNWVDVSRYKPSTPEAESYWKYAERVSPPSKYEKENEIEDAWRDFHNNISNEREMEDRRRRFNWDLRFNPRRVETSSTENGQDTKGAISMAQLGVEPKGGWGKGRNMSREEFNYRFLSGKAPKQDY